MDLESAVFGFGMGIGFCAICVILYICIQYICRTSVELFQMWKAGKRIKQDNEV